MGRKVTESITEPVSLEAVLPVAGCWAKTGMTNPRTSNGKHITILYPCIVIAFNVVMQRKMPLHCARNINEQGGSIHDQQR
jgi:hypothetical protein